MSRRKGQFMAISAIIASLIVMSTASVINEVQDRQTSVSPDSFQIKNIQHEAEKADFGQPGEREKFEEMLESIDQYSVDYSYSSQENCYDITFRDTGISQTVNCIGSNPDPVLDPFSDGFEDGNMARPDWIEWETGSSDGSSQVEDRQSPDSGSKVLSLTESTGGDTAYRRAPEKTFYNWSQEWTVEGLFYIEDYTYTNSNQHHSILLYHSQNLGSAPVKIELGLNDSSGTRPFQITGNLINNAGSHQMEWKRDTWYRYKVSYDGETTYRGKIWEENSQEPSSWQVTSTGDALTPEERRIAIGVDGSRDNDLTVEHAFLRLDRQ